MISSTANRRNRKSLSSTVEEPQPSTRSSATSTAAQATAPTTAATYNDMFTITFSENVENHAGMQQIGRLAHNGFTVDEFRAAAERFEAQGYRTELLHLNDALSDADKAQASEAYVLVIRGGVAAMTQGGLEQLRQEMVSVKDIVDTKAFMGGMVKNKKARYNLCYADDAQEPDYARQKGRVVAFHEAPWVNALRTAIPQYFSTAGGSTEIPARLNAELNYYYDINRCGISFHGDGERRVVIGVRVGASLPLHYQWFHHSEPIGSRVLVELHDGDVYAMSEKAVGTDWKNILVPTLRHATGSSMYTTIQ